jgi:ankyrin repeat protein
MVRNIRENRRPVGVIVNGIITVEVDPEKAEQYTKAGVEFLKAAKRGDADRLKQLLDQDAPVNFLDRADHATALHYIAAYDARPALRVVLKSDKCDFLIRDRAGRLPSELAREYGRDGAMARLLLIKEMRQAQAQGIDPGSLYKVSARKPAP